jgi:TetR/AcrR family transcriptional regulator, tetracycline repressor protein
MAKSPSSQTRAALSREAIFAAGLALVRAEGLGALTMRRLADQLGVKAMSLYNHVEDKADILDGVASLVLAGIERPDPALAWAQQLEMIFLALYTTLAANPWLVAVLTTEGVEPSGRAVVEGIDTILGLLDAAGLPPGERVSAFRGMLALCFGLVTAHTLGLRMSPEAARAQVMTWDPDKWRDAGLPHLAALAPQFLITTPQDDARFMLGAFLAAVGAGRL